VFKKLVDWFSYPNEVVCDPCLGGGTTAIAALSLGRRFIGCEIDKESFKIAEQRIAEFQRTKVKEGKPKKKIEDITIRLGDDDKDISALAIVMDRGEEKEREPFNAYNEGESLKEEIEDTKKDIEKAFNEYMGDGDSNDNEKALNE